MVWSYGQQNVHGLLHVALKDIGVIAAVGKKQYFFAFALLQTDPNFVHIKKS